MSDLFVAQESKSKELVAQANRAVIKTDEDLEKSITLKGLLVKFRTAADKQRLQDTKPLRDRVSAINKEWDTQVINPIKRAEKHLNDISVPYLKLKEEQEKQRRLAAQQQLESDALRIAGELESDVNAQAKALQDLADEYEKQGDTETAASYRERAEALLAEGAEEVSKALEVSNIKTGGESVVRSSYGGSGSLQHDIEVTVKDKVLALTSLLNLAKTDPAWLDCVEINTAAVKRHLKKTGREAIIGFKVDETSKLRARA